MRLTDYRLRDQGVQRLSLKEGEDDYGLVPPGEVGTAEGRDPLQARLAEIIQRMNTLFEGELSEADLLSYANHIRDKMLEHPALAQQAQHNSKEQFALGDFHRVMMETVVDGLGNYQSMAGQVLGNKRVRDGLASLLLDIVYDALQSQIRRTV